MDLTELRLTQKRFRLRFAWDLKLFIDIEILPGYISDLASVPAFARSLVDNDSLIALIAAYVWHDAAFALHLLPYEESNAIFHDLIEFAIREIYEAKLDTLRGIEGADYRKRARRVRRWKRRALRDAKLYRWGVSTFIGRRLYNKSNPTTHWNRDRVRCTIHKLGPEGGSWTHEPQ